MATILILYYKQISEGFEDKKRFEIMQKVGLDHREVRRIIHAQVLMVFFLPLAVGGNSYCICLSDCQQAHAGTVYDEQLVICKMHIDMFSCICLHLFSDLSVDL